MHPVASDQFESRTEAINSPQDLKAQLHRVWEINLTKIPGIKEQSVQIIISEVGLDMTQWNIEISSALFWVYVRTIPPGG